MRKATKIIISFAVVLIAGLNFIVPAFAQDPFTAIAIGGVTGASGAGLFSSMAGMSGININWNSGTSDPVDAMWNVLNPDHVYFSGEKHEADPQTDPGDVWDYITVDIGDWLDAQSDFIVNFAQTYQVDNNDSGTTPNVKYFNGVPINVPIGNWNYSQPLAVGLLDTSADSVGQTFWIGDSYTGVKCYIKSTNRVTYTWYYQGVENAHQDGVSTTYSNNYVTLRYGQRSWNDMDLSLASNSGTYIVRSSNSIGTSVDSQGLPWTSTTVNTNVFNGWESAKVKIPHSISGLTTGWTVPDFTNALNDLWDQGLQGQIVIEDTDQPVPPPPVPSTALGDVPFDDWIDLWGQGIFEQLENQSDALDLIGSNGIDAIEELESIDTNTEDLVDVAESIDTNIGVGNGILGGIRSLAQSAVDYLEGIAEHVEELVEEIVEGTETLIAGILNQIPQAFGVIFGPIKQASSIWHYVVEWIQSIGAPFQFIWSMASGTSYYVILPVYASLAAAVVLAFFKRFGR